ncbi:hypothetical protein QBC34DRAFT_399474 [Podospora aff. communis PSN243]|uniref:Subtilisin-like serine protease protein n=1 Tax=Podospora aff. communis PSN243 TaxID=3040156 RepID=A0AAV9GWY4_9PEZI|nr:hypothetical protein QBC34DRAFT_399474 [Podospora aff. communis PSN243]
MPPFRPETELYTELHLQGSPPALYVKHAITEPQTGSRPERKDHLPGQPRIPLNGPSPLGEYIAADLETHELDILAPHLWLVAKQDSTHISSLTHQRVRGRDIVITEHARLHLTWISERVFLRPIPKYLLSHAFWEACLDADSPTLHGEERIMARRRAMGFLRSYAFLIRHESDFRMAQDEFKLVPAGISYLQFWSFISAFESVGDSEVSPRYHFGELRLGRLNFWIKIFMGKFTYQKVHMSYATYFARFYGPILFAFGSFSVVLSSMQVALAAAPGNEDVGLPRYWFSVVDASRGFSLAVVGITVVICIMMALIFLALGFRETVFALKDLVRKRKEKQKIDNLG